MVQEEATLTTLTIGQKADGMWVDKLENPEAITSIYSHAPTLKNVRVTYISMDENGPTVTLHFNPQKAPDKQSPRWKRAGVNAVTIMLQLMAVEQLTVENWPSETSVDIELSRDNGNKLHLSIADETMKLNCSCLFIRISGIAGFQMNKP